MTTLPKVFSALRRRNRKSYRLLWGCCFFSVLLITAYVSMMQAPTVLAVLPEGGDSRKQSHGGAEHDAFRRVHEAEEHGENADGTADQKTAKNKRTHKEPHGVLFVAVLRERRLP